METTGSIFAEFVAFKLHLSNSLIIQFSFLTRRSPSGCCVPDRTRKKEEAAARSGESIDLKESIIGMNDLDEEK
jgi:hypothetical protein